MTTMGNIDLNIPTENARNEKRSKIAKFVGGAALVGLIAYTIPVGYQELAEGRHERRVRNYLAQGETAKAVSNFDKYQLEGSIDKDDVAKLSPIIEEQRAILKQNAQVQLKQQLSENLEMAVKGFDYTKAKEIMSSVRAENMFTAEEKAKFEAIASNFGGEPVLYDAILTADESKLGSLTDAYIAQFPDGAHRDTVISQWLILAYRNTEKQIANSNAATTLAAVSSMIQELERKWPATPQHPEIQYAKSALRNTLDKRLKEETATGEFMTPGTPVRVVKNDHTMWLRDYLSARSAAAPIGTIGTVDERVSENGSVCVKIITYKNTNDYDTTKCDIETAANVAAFKPQELELARLSINERARLALLSSDLIAAEKRYFSLPPAQEE